MKLQVRNVTDQDISDAGFTFPAFGVVEMTPATLSRISVEPHLAMQLKINSLQVKTVEEPEETGEPVTRTAIAKASKSKLREMIEASGGFLPEPYDVMTADQLRDYAVGLFFGEDEDAGV